MTPPTLSKWRKGRARIPAALPPEAIREGTRMSALWWRSENGKLGDGRTAASVAAGIDPVGVSWRVAR